MTEVLILLDHAEEIRRRFSAALKERFPQVAVTIVDHYSKLMPRLASADVLMSFGKPLGPNADALIAGAKKLKWIQSLGTGVDNIADLPSLSRDVVVTSMRGIHGASVAEAAVFSMMALGRNIARTLRNQAGARWERWPARLLDGKTVGILGIGVIGESLALKCNALGMKVIGITSTPRPLPGFDRLLTRSELRQVVPEFDYLVLLVPYAPETRHIINAEILAAMKPGSYLVNLARGGLVDEDALVAALKQGKPAGAALDVFEVEPLPPGHPFWSMENVIVTPHMGGSSDDYTDKALTIIDKNMRCFLAGTTDGMVNIVKH